MSLEMLLAQSDGVNFEKIMFVSALLLKTSEVGDLRSLETSEVSRAALRNGGGDVA